MKKRIIRFIGVFVIIAMLVLSFAGCKPLVQDPPGSNPTEQDDATDTGEDSGGEDSSDSDDSSGSGEVC
jgi:hypothetical protein